MKMTMLKLVMLTALAGVLALAPTRSFAQEKKDAAPAEKADAAKNGKKQNPRGLPANGKLAAVDKEAKTIKVGERTFHLTDQTRIVKAGQPAKLEDAKVGEQVGIFYREVDGKLMAQSLRLGPAPEGEPRGGKKKTDTKDE